MAKPPSWNDIRSSARRFATRYADATDEQAEKQSFWIDFLSMYGIDHKRVKARFEDPTTRSSTGRIGWIDFFWPGVIAVEHKSAGKDLAEAEQQCLDYLDAKPDAEWPQAIVASDFQRIRIMDLSGPERSVVEFALADLPDHVERFGFLAGYAPRSLAADEAEANIVAARLMGRLYEQVAKTGYDEHETSILLTRLLLLLFGDDTGLWEKDLFAEFVASRTSADGSDLGSQLAHLFEVLDRPVEKRLTTLDELLARFPYVNGGLFSDRLSTASFDREMRDELLACCRFGWGGISPAIFGSLFQAVKSKEARRALGEHYTSEANIMKVIGPLFLDELELARRNAGRDANKLKRLRARLGKMTFLDPACGCGNFLVVAYRELRRLELEIMRTLREVTGEEQLLLDATLGLQVSPSQFHGIEIEEWPARIAETALFLVDHQENLHLAQEFGDHPDRLPISTTAHIVNANALRVEWREVCPIDSDTFIMGNPPFLGPSWQTPDQSADQSYVWAGARGAGTVDFVTNWILIAARLIAESGCHAAFVATNSVAQGQQPAVIWRALNPLRISISFAWQSFVWKNSAPGQAAVHCVVIGFARQPVPRRRLWDSSGGETQPSNINAYLLDAIDVLVLPRTRALSAFAPHVTTGGKPVDGGHLSNLTPEEAAFIRDSDPVAAKYLRRIYGAQELIQGRVRWCLWLVGADPRDLRSSAVIKARSQAVRESRLASSKKATRRDAERPTEFQEVRIPTKPFLAIPEVSSQTRKYIPAMYLLADDVPTNKIQVAEAQLWHFGVVSSVLFMVWVQAISGRLKSDFSISAQVTLNNFPWQELSEGELEDIEAASRAVLEVRQRYAEASLADLYDPIAMPSELLATHRALDQAVLAAHGLSATAGAGVILSKLFEFYGVLMTADQLPLGAIPKRKRRAMD